MSSIELFLLHARERKDYQYICLKSALGPRLEGIKAVQRSEKRRFEQEGCSQKIRTINRGRTPTTCFNHVGQVPELLGINLQGESDVGKCFKHAAVVIERYQGRISVM